MKERVKQYDKTRNLHKFQQQVNPGGGSRLFIASVNLTHNKLVVQAQPLPPSRDVELDVYASSLFKVDVYTSSLFMMTPVIKINLTMILHSALHT